VSTLLSILKWLILIPVLVVAALLGIANDQPVTVNLNPFVPEDTGLQVELALYQVAFLAFVAGGLVGGFAVWNGQRRHRHAARERRSAAAVWRARAEAARGDQAPPPLAPGLPALPYRRES